MCSGKILDWGDEGEVEGWPGVSWGDDIGAEGAGRGEKGEEEGWRKGIEAWERENSGLSGIH